MHTLTSLPEIKFPDSFVWGSATAGHQIEGDNCYSQYWKNELDGVLKERSGKACNHWELYTDDIDLLDELGHKAYRFSIEWSRIEPENGLFCKEALEHYLDLMRRLKERNIEAYVTLHHFTHPQWFEKMGGFRNSENLTFFSRYLDYLVPQISELTDNWIVINEMNLGTWGIDKSDIKANMLKAHAHAYQLIKAYSSAPVSSAHAFVNLQPKTGTDRFDKTLTEYIDWNVNEFFFHALRTGEIVFPYRDMEYVPELKGAIDYWAINYYTRHFVDSRKESTKGERNIFNYLKMIDEDFYLEEFYPEGLILNLERLADLPVIITENGCSCDDDNFRKIYITLHLAAMKEAMKKGIDIRGYFYWSLLDNYEWGSFTPRFGLVEVDFESFKRKPRESAFFYRDIISENRLGQDLIRKHIPDLPNYKTY